MRTPPLTNDLNPCLCGCHSGSLIGQHAAIASHVAKQTKPASHSQDGHQPTLTNKAAAELLTDFAQIAAEDRNILLYVLTDPRGRVLFGEHWAGEARRMVALFRATHDLWADDPAFADLVTRIRSGCREFDVWWTEHNVGAAVSGTKTLYHLARGRRCFAYTTFQANDDPRLKLAVYMPC